MEDRHHTDTQIEAIRVFVRRNMEQLGLDVREEYLDLDPEFEPDNCFMIRGSWLAFEFYGGHSGKEDQMGLIDLVQNRWLVDQDCTDFARIEEAFADLRAREERKQRQVSERNETVAWVRAYVRGEADRL